MFSLTKRHEAYWGGLKEIPVANSQKPPVNEFYSITHALPGQVGFCIPRIAEDVEYLKRLQALLADEPWVISEQINKIAGSIVITYKKDVMSDLDMRSHLAKLIQFASIEETRATGVDDRCGVWEDKEEETRVPPLSHSPTPPLLTSQQTRQAIKQPANVAYSIAHAIPGRVRFRVSSNCCRSKIC